MGGIFFPIAVWLGSAIGAGAMAGDTLFDKAGTFWAVFCFGGIAWLMNNASKLNAAGYTKAQERNKYLIGAVNEQRANAVPAPAPQDRELDLETLRHVQHMLERGLSPKDDFSFHDVIDQFQTGAVRYQLYGVVDALSLYQCHYAPGFHGYLSKASQNCIEKSLQKRIMSYVLSPVLTSVRLTNSFAGIGNGSRSLGNSSSMTGIRSRRTTSYAAPTLNAHAEH